MRNADTLRFEMGPAIRAEHICLESDEFIVAEPPREVRVEPALKVASRLRGCETELAFRADHHLAIRTRRYRMPDRDYVVDLRFVESEPVTERRIAWRCWQATAALLALGVLGAWLDARVSDPRWQQVGLQASIGLLTAAFCAALLAWYRTREIIELTSVHGAVRLAEVTGGLGCSRAAAPFLAELRRRIAAARSQAAQSKQQFLRDEMREHHRLWNEGVLPDAGYDLSKRRILQAHG